jgi:hypothetical protein
MEYFMYVREAVMSSAARDRSARSRIREYLSQYGPIEDATGRATSLLKDAVKYEGSGVAFIQLVTAMDKADEIKREIRGKRTYKISTTADEGAGVSDPERQVAFSVREVAGTQLAIDYDELARALLRELGRVVAISNAPAEPAANLDVVRIERDRLVAERDEYARRLQTARQQLSALLNESMSAVEAGADYAPGAHEMSQVERAS